MPILESDTSEALAKLFNGRYRIVVKAFQTETDRKMGTIYRVRVDIYGGAPYRQGSFEIKVYKDTQA
jgi:hypothetical protein